MFIYLCSKLILLVAHNLNVISLTNVTIFSFTIVLQLEICGDFVSYTFLEMILYNDFNEQCFYLLNKSAFTMFNFQNDGCKILDSSYYSI